MRATLVAITTSTILMVNKMDIQKRQYRWDNFNSTKKWTHTIKNHHKLRKLMMMVEISNLKITLL
jgi:hypothetical protein